MRAVGGHGLFGEGEVRRPAPLDATGRMDFSSSSGKPTQAIRRPPASTATRQISASRASSDSTRTSASWHAVRSRMVQVTGRRSSSAANPAVTSRRTRWTAESPRNSMGPASTSARKLDPSSRSIRRTAIGSAASPLSMRRSRSEAERQSSGAAKSLAGLPSIVSAAPPKRRSAERLTEATLPCSTTTIPSGDPWTSRR